MKNYLTASKVFLLVCASFIVSLTSCSSDDDQSIPGNSGEEVVRFIQTNLYDNAGEVAANQLESYTNGEYNLVAGKESEARAFFTALTGIEAPLQDTYKYVYQSADGKYKISIEGSRQPKNGIYATIRLTVPDYPEIKIVHIGTMAMLEGTNGSGSDMTTTDDLPHRVKGIN